MERNYFVDFIKGVSIIGVFIIHVVGLTFDFENITFIGLYLDAFFRFAVPIFFGVLGYMTVFHYQSITNWTAFFKRKINTILIPYLLWAVLYFFVPTVYPFLENNEGKENPINILLGYSEVHLYFMVPYLTFLALTPLFVLCLRKLSKRTISLSSIIIICFHIYLLMHAEQSFLEGEPNFYYETDYLLIIHWIAYYLVGLFIGVNLDNIQSMWNENKINFKIVFLSTLVYLIFVFIFVGSGRVLWSYVTPLLFLNSMIAFWWMLTIYVKWKNFKPLKWLQRLGRNTFPFYLSHVLFIKIAFLVFCSKEVTVENLLYVGITGFIFSVFYIYLHNKTMLFIKKQKEFLMNEKSYIRF